MNLSGITSSSLIQGVQNIYSRLLAGAGQNATDPIAGAADSSPPAAPAPTADPGPGRFVQTTLAALLSVQQQPTADSITAKIMSNVDTDSDGALTLDEVSQALTGGGASANDALSKAFGKLDADGDGKLSSAELSKAISGYASASQLAAPPAPPISSDIASVLVKTADTNGDGQVSADELSNLLSGKTGANATQASAPATDALAGALNKLDTNGDGKLSADELAQAIQAQMDKVGGHHHHHHRHAPPQTDQTVATATTPAAS